MPAARPCLRSSPVRRVPSAPLLPRAPCPQCAACKALYPRLVKLAASHPEVSLLCVNFDENRALVKALGIKALPFLQFYRGQQGKLAQFGVSASKVKFVE